MFTNWWDSNGWTNARHRCAKARQAPVLIASLTIKLGAESVSKNAESASFDGKSELSGAVDCTSGEKLVRGEI